MKLGAKQLRDLAEDITLTKPDKNPVYLILDNIYDTYNIGGLFRLSDALNITKLFICGESETPPNHKIKKASVGTYKIVPWEYMRSANEAIVKLRNELPEIVIISIEQHEQSIPYTQHHYTCPLAFIVGNETEGVSKDTLTSSDNIVSIPQWGINKSLNVIVSAGIVMYHAYSVLSLTDFPNST